MLGFRKASEIIAANDAMLPVTPSLDRPKSDSTDFPVTPSLDRPKSDLTESQQRDVDDVLAMTASQFGDAEEFKEEFFPTTRPITPGRGQRTTYDKRFLMRKRERVQVRVMMEHTHKR